jgi:hypothetical protein
VIKKAKWSSYKIPVILVQFKWILNFRDMFLKDTKEPNVMKIHLVNPCCSMRTDRRTDMMKLTVAFHNSAIKSKDGQLLCPRDISFTILYCLQRHI